MRDVTGLPGTVSSIQGVSAIERSQVPVPVMKPAPILGASIRDIVCASDMAAKNPTLGDRAGQNPTCYFS